MDDEKRLAFALNATRTGLWAFDPRRTTVDCDETTRMMIGGAESKLPLQTFLSLFGDEQETVRQLIAEASPAIEQTPDFEVRARRLDGRAPCWIALRAQRCGDGSVIGSARDVTETKRDDAQVHMLMREVTHRSKNLLAIIQAMARQTVKDSLTAADFERGFSARLQGLSFSHELLASQDWRGASLIELAEGHLSHISERHKGRVEIAGPIVFVRPEAAQNIGLALNELGSNAQRYGALAGESGTIRLEWHIDSDETGPTTLHMLWTEAGGATEVVPPSRQGFGHRVMERVVARALDAAVSMTFAPTGLRWSLKIPLSRIAGEAAADV